MKLKRSMLIVVAMCAMIILTGCGEQVNPDAVGLKYSSGELEGKKFDRVLEPGEVDTWVYNDEIYQLPISQRSFIIRKDDKADINGYITVPSKGGENGSTLIDFEVSTAFKLNTRTDDIKDFPGGTARKFYEDLCRHYTCDLDSNGDSPDGWKQLLREKLYPQLEAAFKDEARKYSGDALANNTPTKVTVKDPKTGEDKEVTVATLSALQTGVGQRFLQYLERQTGAKFFCGPSFNRDKNAGCPPVELIISSADYHNPDVRKAREEKKIASDRASAQATLRKPLKDPNYLEYLKIQAMETCAKNAKAVCVIGTDSSNGAYSRSR